MQSLRLTRSWQKATLLLLCLVCVSCSSNAPVSPKGGLGISQPMVKLPEDNIDGELDMAMPSPGEGVVDEALPVLPAPGQPADLWQRLRDGFEFDHTDNPLIAKERAWFIKNKAFLIKVNSRARRYLYYVIDELERNELPLEFALLPVVESAYNPYARAPGGASGMWQFVPGTARVYGLKADRWYDGSRDVVDSTQAAIRMLKQLHREFNGDWFSVIAAYNSGAGTVNNAIQRNQRRGRPTHFWALDLPAGTKAYVPKLIALSQLIRDPARYGLQFEPIPNQPYFAEINVGSRIDLGTIAKLSSVPIQELQDLNPGYKLKTTPPSGPYRVLVPYQTRRNVEKGLAMLTPTQRLSWQTYVVRRGDTIEGVARQAGISTTTLRAVNGLGQTPIQPGKALLVPANTQMASASVDKASRLHNGKHIVKSGENLWTIARRYGTDVRSLARLNGLTDKSSLKVGQTLVVDTNGSKDRKTSTAGQTKRIGYKVQSGDSLSLIADRFNVKVQDIISWNTIKPGNTLRPGQNLTLYLGNTARNPKR